jgi:hypothetical protein
VFFKSKSTMIWPRALALLAACCLVVTSMSCASWPWWVGGGAAFLVLPSSRVNHLYNATYQPPGFRTLTKKPPRAHLAFVEADDHGWLRDLRQGTAVLDTIESLSRTGNLAVILYVHGWRHNASENDKDVRTFALTLDLLAKTLDRSEFRELRREVSGIPTTTVLGIYVGWRGKMAPELPGFINVINLPVYTTFWNRKQVANAVGGGDIRKFLQHLDDQFQRINQRRPRRRMSLVILGHSFGGHIVFDAVRDRIESNLYAAILRAERGSAALQTRLGPRANSPQPIVAREMVRGFGDLIVLINPAIEADSYRRIDQMVHSARFEASQVPILIVVSAKNDWARNSMFATARGMSLWMIQKTKEQSQLLGRALGSYKPQLTHELELIHPDAKEEAREDIKLPKLTELSEGPTQQRSIRASTKQEPVAALSTITPTDPGPVRLRALDARFDAKPAYVVLASPDVIDNHSHFFRVGFANWLSSYVLKIQKRNLEVMRDTLRRKS